jgi:hypothetical protein
MGVPVEKLNPKGALQMARTDTVLLSWLFWMFESLEMFTTFVLEPGVRALTVYLTVLQKVVAAGSTIDGIEADAAAQ